MTTWMYGQAPSRGDYPGSSAFGKGGSNSLFLARLAGVSEDAFHERVVCRNVLHEYPGRASGKGDAFPMDVARRNAYRETTLWADGDVVVFAGRNVAGAFGFHGDWYQWRTVGRYRGPYFASFRATVMPHPSRVSHYWNDPDNVHSAAEFMRELLDG